MDYRTQRRLEQVVEKLARDMGLDGDLFAKYVPDCGTREQEYAIIELRLDAKPSGREEKEFVERLARSVVLTSSPELMPYKHMTMKHACEDYITSQLEGKEIPPVRQTWHIPQANYAQARRAARCR